MLELVSFVSAVLLCLRVFSGFVCPLSVQLGDGAEGGPG